MIYKLYRALEKISPWFKSLCFKVWYQFLAGLPFAEELLFMNYGFLAEQSGDPLPGLESGDAAHRLCIGLYQHTVSGTVLAGRQVLEVGCGRGGGASYLARYLQPARMIGLDFSSRAIAFCRGYHKAANLAFVRGNAMSLPFPDRSYDVVVNVESSHGYTSFAAFAREVYRVLKPGGSLLITDLREVERLPSTRAALLAAGFTLAEEELITAQILKAMDREHEHKVQLIREKTPRLLHEPLLQFAGTRYSRVYRQMQAGEIVYFRYKLSK